MTAVAEVSGFKRSFVIPPEIVFALGSHCEERGNKQREISQSNGSMKLPNGNYIPPAHVWWVHLALRWSIRVHVGSPRISGDQHVSIGNAKVLHLGYCPM